MQNWPRFPQTCLRLTPAEAQIPVQSSSQSPLTKPSSEAHVLTATNSINPHLFDNSCVPGCLCCWALTRVRTNQVSLSHSEQGLVSGLSVTRLTNPPGKHWGASPRTEFAHVCECWAVGWGAVASLSVTDSKHLERSRWGLIYNHTK